MKACRTDVEELWPPVTPFASTESLLHSAETLTLQVMIANALIVLRSSAVIAKHPKSACWLEQN